MAGGASIMANVDHKISLISGIHDLLPNRTGGAVMQKNLETLNKSQYLYNLNYVVSNGDRFISPLIAINEFSQASKVIKDTIRKSMSKEVQESKYGKIFEKLVEKTRVN